VDAEMSPVIDLGLVNKTENMYPIKSRRLPGPCLAMQYGSAHIQDEHLKFYCRHVTCSFSHQEFFSHRNRQL
jgi:hypothetical protein